MDPPVRWLRPTRAAKITKDRPHTRTVLNDGGIGPSECTRRRYGETPRTVLRMTAPNPRGGACAPSKGRSPGSLLFSAPFPERKTSQWVRPMLPSLQWRVRAGLAPDFPNTFRGCVVCPITIRQKMGMSNGFHSPAAFRTTHSSRRTAARAPAPFVRGALRYNMLEVHAEHAPEKPKGRR